MHVIMHFNSHVCIKFIKNYIYTYTLFNSTLSRMVYNNYYNSIKHILTNLGCI